METTNFVNVASVALIIFPLCMVICFVLEACLFKLLLAVFSSVICSLEKNNSVALAAQTEMSFCSQQPQCVTISNVVVIFQVPHAHVHKSVGKF